MASKADGKRGETEGADRETPAAAEAAELSASMMVALLLSIFELPPSAGDSCARMSAQIKTQAGIRPSAEGTGGPRPPLPRSRPESPRLEKYAAARGTAISVSAKALTETPADSASARWTETSAMRVHSAAVGVSSKSTQADSHRQRDDKEAQVLDAGGCTTEVVAAAAAVVTTLRPSAVGSGSTCDGVRPRDDDRKRRVRGMAAAVGKL